MPGALARAFAAPDQREATGCYLPGWCGQRGISFRPPALCSHPWASPSSPNILQYPFRREDPVCSMARRTDDRSRICYGPLSCWPYRPGTPASRMENRSQDNGLRAGPGAKTMPLRKPSPLRRELAARSQKEATGSRSPSGSLEGNILEAPIRRDHLGTNFLPVKRAPVSQILRHLDPIAQFMAP